MRYKWASSITSSTSEPLPPHPFDMPTSTLHNACLFNPLALFGSNTRSHR